MNNRYQALSLIFFILLLTSPATGKASKLATISMYADKLYSIQQDDFQAMDKIYGMIPLNVEQPGDHILTTDWYTPFNAVEHQTIYRFTSSQPDQTFRLYSWIQLWKRGPLTRTFTGQDFKQEFYGQWTVRFYLDGQLVGKKNFEVH